MATQKILYGSVTAFTITGTSLGSYAAREGTIVSNSTNAYVDMMISGSIYTGAAVPTGNVYMLLSSSDGTSISYPATGSDAGIAAGVIPIETLGSLQPGQMVPGTELIYAFTIQTRGLAAATKIPFGGIYVAQLFNGNIPIGGIAPVLVNCQGQAFDATAGHTVIDYTGLTYTIA